MTENGSELRKIAWSQAFPFVRLFQTLRLALGVNRLVLALACVIGLYVGGRILDLIWGEGRGVAAMPADSGLRSEIQVYSETNHSGFATWLREAREARDQRAVLALLQANKAVNAQEAQVKLATRSLRDLLIDDQFQKELDDLTQLARQRLQAGLSALDANTTLSKTERADKRQTLIEAADTVRRMLAGSAPRGPAAGTTLPRAIEMLVAADPQLKPAERSDDQARLTAAMTRWTHLNQYEEIRPQGPFISLFKYEDRCFAGAVRGALAGRWGFSAGAFAAEPAMAGSIGSALRGLCWLVTQRPFYTLILGLFSLVVLGLLGGAICRSAAVQSARDESISIRDALGFVLPRFGGFLLAPLMPVAVLVGIALIMGVCGLLGGVIPWLGEVVTGLIYPLALLGGFAAAILVLATVLGFHLMWPTIAVEGSDGFDALSRACSYLGSRIWHVAFYTFVLLLYGAASFVLVRLVVVLTLKLSHGFTGLGMNVLHASKLSGAGNLDVMWSMPAWADLSLLPPAGDLPLYGSFFNGPLGSGEAIGTWLLRLWVYLLVGLLVAFVISYFFCGSTQMYFLLRREVDATDYEELYYEEKAEEFPVPQVAQPAAEPPAEAPAPAEAPDQPGDEAGPS